MTATPATTLLVLLYSTAHALYFQDGFDHHYTYSSDSDILGMHNVTTVIKFRIRPVNVSDAEQNLYLLMVDSFVQHSEKNGYVMDNPMQWNFDLKFFFTVGTDGLVTLVHYHPDEIHEVLTIKKVVASTLSTRVQLGEGDNWSFTSHEEDHTGRYEHEYKGLRHPGGVSFVRSHNSTTDVHRMHTKTIQFDNTGTLVHVDAIDNITLRQSSSQNSRMSVEGIQDIEEDQIGEFPKIASVSRSKVKLTIKQKHDENSSHTLDEMRTDSLAVKQKEAEKRSLNEIADKIQEKLKCAQSFSNKFEVNRTSCVSELKALIRLLNADDLTELGRSVLSKKCNPDNVICIDERNLFIDIIGHEKSHEAQTLLLEYVLQNPNVTEGDLQRCLFHAVAFSSPHPEFVKHVEGLCFGDNTRTTIGEVTALSNTEKRACLSLGAMAKSLQNVNETESDRIVERIENWLGHHDEKRSMAIIKPRRRRAINERNVSEGKHIETKMILIQSLGNAGKARSLQHIKSYMQPNMGVTVWRRAAIHSLRHFSCNESAHALLASAVDDDDNIVKKTALSVLKKHPKSDSFTDEHENMILSKTYTYQNVVRVRRSLLETLEKGINVILQAPSIEWEHTLGTKDIGASFGLHIQNVLDLKLALLTGHFKVDVYDEAHAEAHVGMVGLQVDIIKARICFKGHIQYNLNVLKDFSIDSLSDLATVFDSIVKNITTPIKKAVDGFKAITEAFKGRSIQQIVRSVVETIQNLPTILGDVTKRLQEFVREIFSISSSVIMEEIKVIVQFIRYFVDSVKSDILKFYNDLVDAVTMALPYITNKIKEAFSSAVEALGELFNNPLQAITAVSKAISDIKMAVTMVVDVKNKVLQVCNVFKGRSAEWIATAKEAPKVIKRLMEVFKKLADSINTHRHDQESDMMKVYSDGVDQMKNSTISLDFLLAKWNETLKPLQPLLDLVKIFSDEFHTMMEIITSLKKSYLSLKTAIEHGKFMIQKLFGPKFHKSFPTERRPAAGQCTAGVWNTTTQGIYKTQGVDIKVEVRQLIVMPFTGIIHVQHDNQRVRIKPDDLKQIEIVIENIVSPANFNNRRLPAGKVIGTAGTETKCGPNFIHVSVRDRKIPVNYDDLKYNYTDPSPFLGRMIPIPKWIRECNDHEFRYIGQTFEAGESTESDYPEKITEKINRDRSQAAEFSELNSASDSLPPDNIYDTTSFKDSLMESVREEAKKFAEFFKTALFGDDGPEVPNILSIVNVNIHNVSWLLEHLMNNTSLYKDIHQVINRLSNCTAAIPIGNPATMALSFVNKKLQQHGLPITFGDVGKVTDSLMTMAEKVCPLFKGAIAMGFGHVCTVHDECMGITCSIPIHKASRVEHITISVSVNLKDKRIELEINGSRQHLKTDGVDTKIDFEVKLFGMKLYVIANGQFVRGSYVLSAEVKICAKLFSTCLPPIEIFHRITFSPGTSRHKRAIPEFIQPLIHELSIPKFMEQLGECQLLGKDVTKVLDDVRGSVVKQLLSQAVDKLGEIVTEFKEKVDFCVRANIPVPPLDIEIFSINTLFMVGPVPLRLKFGASGILQFRVGVGLCVLRMSSNVTLTPKIGAHVWGVAAVDIGFAYGGIRLDGYLLETKFPMTTELEFSKYPIRVGARMDMELTPLRLKLSAFAKLRLIFVTVTVWEGTLWEYSVPKITRNIFHKIKEDVDFSPPQIMPQSIQASSPAANVTKRSLKDSDPTVHSNASNEGCAVIQIAGRPYYDPAFSLELHAEDEVSQVKLFYAIGTHKGGTNVIEWTEMGGSSLFAPKQLPGGIPLYWTVKAKNSQGLETVTQCFLSTYDSTLPDGRVEHPYKFSSHPSKLVASVVVFEDSPLVETHSKAVGFSPGEFGSQVVDWQHLQLDHSSAREGVSGALRHFTVPRNGKLVAFVLKSQETSSEEKCAQTCKDFGANCVSFDFDYMTKTCDLHDTVEGANAYIHISGTFRNYERLDTGYNALINYDNLPLKHGVTYFVNANITNVLGYNAYLVGEGTMIDFTPPEPGIISNSRQDSLRVDNCSASVSQKNCIDVTWQPNHRVIVDGPGSGTVFNGHEPLTDELYTLTNHFVSANWKGFHDDESGISGYAWAVGRQVCDSDVVPFQDPYAHLSSKQFWTDSALHKDIHLEDGLYYITVQALNGAELGGALVTTVCHSTPFIVDTTPPVLVGITDIIYDEDFDLIAIYYNASDDLSKIADAEFGLGETKYDVKIKPYSLHASLGTSDPFIAVEDLGLKEGVPAWIRIRVTNNVALFTTGHGVEPILIDKTPPLPGNVLDGDQMHEDKTYQSDVHRMCAQWVDFSDPESGIDKFMWGVGSSPGKDDIVRFHNLTRYTKSSCSPGTLEHNHTYYSTVFVYNNALNSKSANQSSDGVLVDITPPSAGTVFDGKTDKDMKYSSETVSKYSNWNGFSDEESGIETYKVDVHINELKHSFDVGPKTRFEDHTISMKHNDHVSFKVHGINGANLEIAAYSDGFIVDLTPPILVEISDNDQESLFQSNNAQLQLSWHFTDEESGIEEYQTVIYETKYGMKRKFWPTTERCNTSKPISLFSSKITVLLDNLNMTDGALYSLHVTAINSALLATSHETNGITIDTSPPSLPTVHIGFPKDEEDLNENNDVLHDDQNNIRVSWSSLDPQSGITNFLLAIGTTNNSTSILTFTDFGKETQVYIQNIYLEPTSKSKVKYVVSVKAINGAGLESGIGNSKNIVVQEADVPGIVLDGRHLYQDEEYTSDHTSIAASFYGFDSASCNIIGYEWAIGTNAYGTDVLSYTNYGLVMNNDTHGQCQIHTELFEDTTYFITVRAITGCDNKYILSSSDGITLDRKPPDVIFKHDIDNDTNVSFHQDVFYQATADILHIKTNVSDKNSVASFQLALGSLPLLDDYHAFTDDFESLRSISALEPGKTLFITAYASDKAGNSNLTSSTAIIADITSPRVQNLECSKYLSVRKSLLTCTWETLIEYESIIKSMSISLGSDSHVSDILELYILPKGFNSFSRDLNKQITTMRNMTSISVNVVIENVLGHRTFYGRTVVVDRTAPKVERLEVVTTVGKETAKEHQKCQLPRTFAKLQLIDAVDEESDIDTKRYEVAIGYQPYGTDILNYVQVVRDSDGTFFVDGFVLQSGAVFYASLRIYNKAGLKTDATTDSVVISQVPYLEVFDGAHDNNDIDYQSVSNIIQGHWRYSDLCPIKEASWYVQDLTGRILFENQQIPNAGNYFYNDEVSLENGMKYTITVKTVDFIDRVKIGRSDGFSVRIQPPIPGIVRDGTNEDQNFQVITTELSANWDSFGDNSNDPTQVIHHYEVAIGNDRRYAKTRSNVHYFVNVGLNRSYTFVNMNLTSKLVRYYVTVRAYSIAGGFAESYSNGIRVGYKVAIVPGTISLNKYQSACSSIDVSWRGFTSDIEIIDYKIAISSHDRLISNDTLKCTYFFQNAPLYDIRNLRSVGLNTYTQVKDLNLLHGHTYYVSVVAEDEAGMCTGVTSEPVLIDTTVPQVGTIFINGLVSNTVVFARTRTEMHIEWRDFRDDESSIIQTNIALYECSVCLSTNEMPTDNRCVKIAENVVKDDVRMSFYELALNTNNTYYVTVSVLNGARNVALKQSSTILFDSSNPLSGDVKITNDWSSVRMYQHSTSEITGFLAIADTYDEYLCLSQSDLLLEGINEEWTYLREHFSKDYVVVNQTGAFLGIGYNSDLTDITKSAVVSEKLTLDKGNYSFSLTAAKGPNIVTTVAIFTSYEAIPFRLINKPIEQYFDDNSFSNMSGLTSTENKTSNFTESFNRSATNVSDINASNVSKPIDFEEYGFGFHLLGYTIETDIHWHHLFWARNKYSFTERWFQLNFDPSIGSHKYTIQVEKRVEYLEVSLDLKLIVEGIEIVSISGFKFNGEMNIAAMTWNENNYLPPLVDIYHPYYSEAFLSQTQIPDNREKPCRHGRGFHDGESGIKEVWVGVSDSVNKMGNISPVKNFKSFCFQCRRQCENLCKAPCEDAKLGDGFTLVPINVSGLFMAPTSLSDNCHGNADPNTTTDVACNSTAYYLNVKVVNFAGEETIAYSNAIQIDLTPPVCEYIKCVDPAYNEDEPTHYIGSRSMIGAYWNCSEDTSQIKYYLVQVVTPNGSTIMNNTNVGKASRTKFVLSNNPFEDRKNYTLELSAMNTAGLSVNVSCSVHVSLYPPDILGTSAEPLHTEFVSSQSENKDLYWTTSQTSVGITWQGGSVESEFYEWKIGTRNEADDILPPMKVGMDPVGSAEVDHGKLKFNNIHINRTVGQFRNTINMSAEQVQNLTTLSEREKSFFYMEPGRCMHQSLHAIGYSHLKSKARQTTVCVKRGNDIFLSANVSEIVASKSITAMKWEPGIVTSPEIVVKAKLLSGGVTLGTLMNNDKTSQYGIAASAEYKPFIADFTTTRDLTSRLLRHRIKKTCNLSFYLSPAPFAEYNSVDIHITIPAVCPNDPDSQPALIYWDADQSIWVHIDEGCRDYLTAKTNNGVYSSKLCQMNEFQNKTKRSAASTFESPKAFEVVFISKYFHNSAPKIITESLHFIEDTVAMAKVETVDNDSDELHYDIAQQPLHMHCQIDDVAQLQCILDENFYGIDYITIKATEVHLPVNETSKTAIKTILLNVTAVPDKTDRYFIDKNGYVHTVKRPILEHTIKIDAHTSNTLFVGRILLADVDGEETFTCLPRFTPIENSSYTLSDTEVPLRFLENFTSAAYRSMKAYDVNVNFSPKAKGKMTLQFIATTSDGSYTPGVSLSIYVLENPCVYGHCGHEALGDAGCDSTKRAESFAGFYCVCDAGYTGKLCQTNIDECEREPCPLMHDCNDLVDDYSCKINVPKLVAALIGSIVGVGLVVFIMVKLVKKYKRNKVGQSRVNLMEENIYRSNHVPDDDDETEEIKFPAALVQPMTKAYDVFDNTSISMEKSERVSKIRFNHEWFQQEESYFSSAITFNPIMQSSLQHSMNPINAYDVSPLSHTMRTSSPTPLDTLCEELRKSQQSRFSGQITNVEI